MEQNMKSLILIFVSLFFLNAQAQDKTADSSTPDPANVSYAATMAAISALNKNNDQDCQGAIKDVASKNEDIRDKIEDLQKEQADDKKDIIKEINEKDAAIAQADVDYKKELNA